MIDLLNLYLLQQAQLDYQTTHFKQSNETETWQTWATDFVSFCQDHAYVDLLYHYT